MTRSDEYDRLNDGAMLSLSILRSFDTNGCILRISMAKITFSRVYTCVRAYVRTNLIDVDLRESTCRDFSNKCSFAAIMTPVYDYNPIRYLSLNYQGYCPRESCSPSFSFSYKQFPVI